MEGGWRGSWKVGLNLVRLVKIRHGDVIMHVGGSKGSCCYKGGGVKAGALSRGQDVFRFSFPDSIPLGHRA